jgi:hypothetical protein
MKRKLSNSQFCYSVKDWCESYNWALSPGFYAFIEIYFNSINLAKVALVRMRNML